MTDGNALRAANWIGGKSNVDGPSRDSIDAASDMGPLLRVAQAIEAGSVWINDWTQVFDSTEEGGFKQSGLGRLNGLASFSDFIEYKHIALNPDLMPLP
jgi:hypothetical protein